MIDHINIEKNILMENKFLKITERKVRISNLVSYLFYVRIFLNKQQQVKCQNINQLHIQKD
jgi:hypothetical protein